MKIKEVESVFMIKHKTVFVKNLDTGRENWAKTTKHYCIPHFL